MKKIILVLCLILSPPALAFEPKEYMMNTATLSADAAAVSGAGYLYGIVFVGDGSNACSADVYDNSSATGTKLSPTLEMASTPRVQVLSFDPPVPFNTGVYVDITTSGTLNFMVYYREK